MTLATELSPTVNLAKLSKPKMLQSLVFLAILALTAAATIDSHRNHDIEQPQKPIIDVVRIVDERQADGSFHFAYEGTDGSYRQEVGHIVNPGTDDEELVVSGSYRYYDADGQLIEVQYTAGKGGFVPIGTNIPQEISVAASEAAQVARSQALAAERDTVAKRA